MAPALARDPGVFIPGLGAKPAEPGHPLSHTHSQHLGPTYPLASPPPLLHNLAARPTLPGPSTRLPAGQHYTPRPALERDPEAMGMCRGFGVTEKATEAYTTTPLSRCPLRGARDSRLSQCARTGPF